MFRETSAPHSKSTMETLKEALKSDWRSLKTTKHIYPMLIQEEDEENVEEVEGETTYL